MATKFDYLDARNFADELIQFFGMDAVLRRADTADRPCVVAIVEWRPRERPTDLTNPTDRYVIMSAKTPEVLALPPDDEKDYLVTYKQLPTGGPVLPLVEDEVLPLTAAPKPTAPSGIVACYEFTVRR